MSNRLSEAQVRECLRVAAAAIHGPAAPLKLFAGPKPSGAKRPKLQIYRPAKGQ